MLGEAEKSLDLLERAVALGYGDRVWMMRDSDLALLQDAPRFKALMDRMQ